MEKTCNERLGAAIENAANKLPEGYSILIEVEKGSGTVKLIDPHRTYDQLIDTGGEGLDVDINCAVERAVQSSESQP